MDTFMKQTSANIHYELTARVVGKCRCFPRGSKLKKKKRYLEQEVNIKWEKENAGV